MAKGAVVVHSIGDLEEFCSLLGSIREGLDELYQSLYSQAVAQRENWQDEQYEYLRNQLEEYCRYGKGQLCRIDDSIKYVRALILKLRDI